MTTPSMVVNNFTFLETIVNQLQYLCRYI